MANEIKRLLDAQSRVNAVEGLLAEAKQLMAVSPEDVDPVTGSTGYPYAFGGCRGHGGNLVRGLERLAEQVTDDCTAAMKEVSEHVRRR